MTEFESTTNSTVYRRLVREKFTGCSFCPPHRNENGHWKKPVKKKSYQLNPNKRHKIR